MSSAGRETAQARVRGAARLDELIGVILALEERVDLSPREQHRLDRELGAQSSSLAGLPRVRDWLGRAPSEALTNRLQRLRGAMFGLAALLGTVGFFLGWAAAAALLSIEVHAGRINIVLAWGLLVAIPFLAWFVSGLVWLASRFFSSSSDAPSLGEFVRRISVGRLALRLLPASIRDDVELVMGRMTAHGRLYGRVERGQLLRWSHLMGLGFALGAFVSTVAFVVFTDLAFGWSTTLDLTADSVHRLVRIIAAPWAGLWPEASPSLALVESTRYFRVSAQEHIHVVDPIVYGGWWPFLAASILTYGILPRALGLVLVGWVQNREVGRAIGLTLGVDRLLERLDTPFVEGQATEAELEVGRLGTDLVPEVELGTWLSGSGNASTGLAVLRWAEILDETTIGAAVSPATPEIFDAGGTRSLSDDTAAIDAAAKAAGNVVFFVRGYEPPVLEILDFMSDWRRRAGENARLCVALVDGDADDVDTWRRKLIGLGDPGVVVARVVATAAAEAEDV